jgi:peptidoglycan/LPS O-acetylase OafA/YrhL
MGALRLYLALCVVADHSGAFPFPTHSGTQAVQLFFLISGFHMSLVQDRYPHAAGFWRSRFLRIFPATWAALTVAVCASVGYGVWRGHWVLLGGWTDVREHYGTAGATLAGISNVTLFFQDWVMFLSQGAGQALHFTTNFFQDPHPLFKLLVFPQMWSVGLELSFYLLVPFLWRKSTPWLVGLAALSTGLRLAAYLGLGLTHDPWDYRFFPFELGVFLLGMVSQRLGGRVTALPKAPFWIRTVALMSLFVGIGWLQRQAEAAASPWANLVAIPLWALVLPFLFATTKNCWRDRFLGDLSFPVYLVHMLAIHVALQFAPLGEPLVGPLSAAISLLLAWILWRWVERPMDRLRHRIHA